MRRIISVLAVMAVVAALVAASAMPAFAYANPKANCLGNTSFQNYAGKAIYGEGGLGGEVTSNVARQEGGHGDRASNC